MVLVIQVAILTRNSTKFDAFIQTVTVSVLRAWTRSPGEKKELNRTYELEKELVEIRQQIGDVEYNDN